jgi:hypothetical protein
MYTLLDKNSPRKENERVKMRTCISTGAHKQEVLQLLQFQPLMQLRQRLGAMCHQLLFLFSRHTEQTAS